MMSADRTIVYSGLPQEDWKNKPKQLRILLNGPDFPKASRKACSRSCVKTFSLITFVLCVVALLLVLGFHIFELPNNKHFHFWDTAKSTPESANKYSSTAEVLQEQEKELQNSHHDDGSDKEELFKPSSSTNYLHLEPTAMTLTNSTVKNLHLNSQISETPTAPLATPEMKTNPTHLTKTLKAEPTITVLDGVKVLLSSSRSTEIKVSTSKPENHEERVMDKTNNTMNTTDLEHQDLGGFNNDTSQVKPEYTSNETLAGMVIRFASKYLNSRNPDKEKTRQWIEDLMWKPSLEVVVIAAGIIFVGLSLLIIAVSCMVAKRSRVKRRREKIGNSFKDFENNEKIVLLAEDVSEDEYVKT